MNKLNQIDEPSPCDLVNVNLMPYGINQGASKSPFPQIPKKRDKLDAGA